jgi:predicted O-methyltransferase YrrM
MAGLPALVSRRPRLTNALHAMRLTPAQSSTTREELDCLARHASERRSAIEIGTHMGVSAVVIARAIQATGTLTCVDPWTTRRGLENPSLLICRRELRRNAVAHKVRFARGVSDRVGHLLPDDADFMFVDGDHSRQGISTDWRIVQTRLVNGGIVCFHDTSAVAGNPQPPLESVGYFRDVILPHPAFEHVETCQTLNVLRRIRPR